MMMLLKRSAYWILGYGVWMSLGCGTTSGNIKTQTAARSVSAQAARAKGDALFDLFSKNVAAQPQDKPLPENSVRTAMLGILKEDPKHPAALFNLAILAKRSGNPKQATQKLRDILAYEPDFSPALENIAATEDVAAGRFSKAANMYRDILDREPKNQTSRLALARLMLREKRYEEAIDLARAVLQRKANIAEAFRILAKAYLETGNAPMAELVLGRGLKAEKDDPELNLIAADLSFQKNDLAATVYGLKHVVAQKPDWLHVRARLAEIAMTYRDYGTASQQFEAIRAKNPNDMDAYINLAVAYKGLGRYQKAQEIYTDILAKTPNDADALWNSARLYHTNLYDYGKASELYRQFEAHAPPGDANKDRIPELLEETARLAADMAAQEERIRKEEARRQAVQRVCAANASNQPYAMLTDAIGSETERIEAAWALVVDGQTAVQEERLEDGMAAVSCAFAILPQTPKGKTEACAPMAVMWTQVLYNVSRVLEANETIAIALACDPNNPDAQLISSQLKEIIEAQALDASAAPESSEPSDAAQKEP